MSSNGIGPALLAELREVFGAVVWIDEGLPRLKFPEGYTPFAWDIAFIKDHRGELRAALMDELQSQSLGASP